MSCFPPLVVCLALSIVGCTTPTNGTCEPENLIDPKSRRPADFIQQRNGVNTSNPTPEYVSLFDTDTLPIFYLTIPEDSWDKINSRNNLEQVYERGSFRYEETVLENVGIRLKGRASFQTLSEKPGFKIKFDAFNDKQSFSGLRRLTLNNQIQDPTRCRERLGYLFFRKVGIDAPLCNSARVFVNGIDYGLYANVQSIDDVFVEQHYAGYSIGNLYDTINNIYFTDLDRAVERGQEGKRQESRFQLETNTGDCDYSGLSRAIDAVYNEDQLENWYRSELEAWIDLDQFLLVAAAQHLIADWDGFFGARNNYKLYQAPDTGRFIVIPWGIDSSLDAFGEDYCIDGSSPIAENALFFNRCKQVRACWDRYLEALRRVLEEWNSTDWSEELTRIEAQLVNLVAQDNRSPYGLAEWESAMERLRRFTDVRASVVQSQLDSQACQE